MASEKVRKVRRLLKWAALLVPILAVGAVAAFAASYPAVVAAACPRCYGFEPVGDRVYVGNDMTAEERRRLGENLASARETVAAALGPTEARPFVFACSTDGCDRRVGGRGREGAAAEAQNTPWFGVVRFGPRGIDETVLAHELAHVTLHEVVGAWPVMDGRFPAWLNEGVAVIVSNDARYLRPGETADERCLVEPDGPLPESPFEWAPASGLDRSLYARAACASLRWLEANGGAPGLLAALRRVAETGEAVAR